MNPEDFTFYAALALIVAVAGAVILWDAWLDRRDAAKQENECCPRGYGCDKCYYGLGK
jgi:hypothetical protein